MSKFKIFNQREVWKNPSIIWHITDSHLSYLKRRFACNIDIVEKDLS